VLYVPDPLIEKWQRGEGIKRMTLAFFGKFASEKNGVFPRTFA
jgi:hypothetical protein